MRLYRSLLGVCIQDIRADLIGNGMALCRNLGTDVVSRRLKRGPLKKGSMKRDGMRMTITGRPLRATSHNMVVMMKPR
jgi:hypothetical protein